MELDEILALVVIVGLFFIYRRVDTIADLLADIRDRVTPPAGDVH